jgi:beta-lactamase regulating signal transducer with metallopeptidase domain
LSNNRLLIVEVSNQHQAMHTLTTFFDWLLTASLRASVLTLGVWLVQIVLQRHLSPRWRYALWLPVLVVLLMPVLPESRWSVASVFTVDAPAVEVPPVSVIADGQPAAMPAPAVSTAKRVQPVDWSRVRVIIWAAGTTLVLLTGLISFTRTLRRARRSREAISDELATRIDEVTQEVGLRQKPRLLMSARIQSPAVTGLLRPLLLLPPGFDRDFTAEEKSLILHHELMHLKRGDLPLNTLLCVLMALHWFSLLLWLAFLKVRADREAACDAQVLENATPQRRSAYGHALLKIESAFAPLRLSLGFIGILQRHASLRARIRSIAAPTRTRPFTGLVVTACMLVMTFLGVTRAEKPVLANPPAKLMRLEVRIIQFKQPSEWDFGGRLPTLAAGEKAELKTELLDQQELEKLLAEAKRQPGAHVTSYPKMTVRAGEKASIRSVVNQPVVKTSESSGNTARTDIDYLPIGFIGNFVVKPLADSQISLDVDITNSHIIGEQQIAGNPYPIVHSVVCKTPLELAPGMSAIVYGWQEEWEDGKRQKPRPVLFALTPEDVQMEAGDANRDLPPQVTISTDQAVHDKTEGVMRYTGNAKLEMHAKDGRPLSATSDEIIYLRGENRMIVKAPLEIVLGSVRISCEDQEGEAGLDLKTGKLKMGGASFRTELLPTAAADQSPAEAHAALLRAARPQRYDFAKADLGDVLRYLAMDADIKFISLPEDHPASKKLVTFSIEESPFSVLETISKANGLMLVLDRGVWHIRPSNDADLISRSYPLLKTKAKPAEVSEALQKLIKAPATVKFDEKTETFHINGTRLQHTWVESYFRGLHGKQ